MDLHHVASFMVLVAFAGLSPVCPDAAVCNFKSNGKKDAPDGIVYFRNEGGRVRVCGKVSGVPPGKHGFHIHVFGDLIDGCLSIGRHYNPFKHDHGSPNDIHRHDGDLGNVDVNMDGVAEFDFYDTHIRLEGPFSIMGRAMVVHVKEDDLGRGGDAGSKRNGNAGGRLGCCIIGYANTTYLPRSFNF